ncbi:hypothetical protein IBTHAUMO2_380011 [Nitrosopumilaceae archaeon]|nr:hypothetical protein [Nitrosopumilus sp.]CAI9831707.1 hypothetical protein IBTHAUMO2_380011 [Nitrosopumilaceae archaeon]MDA7944444.1 hypothetical protein [Nitrosopumilus sp.]MDA7954196.1 hypothetical protein [Nitrosopumilus sp.]MDA7973208.1 hypothetical protein [Nitrosopumilus sp.]
MTHTELDNLIDAWQRRMRTNSKEPARLVDLEELARATIKTINQGHNGNIEVLVNQINMVFSGLNARISKIEEKIDPETDIGAEIKGIKKEMTDLKEMTGRLGQPE